MLISQLHQQVKMAEAVSVPFYHYTTRESFDKIKEENVIKQSEEDTDSCFGASGVYLTTMPPEVGREKLIKNNFDGGLETREQRKPHVEAFFRVWIPATELGSRLRCIKKVDSRKDKKRDVWFYDGNLNLKQYQFSSGLVDCEDYPVRANE